MAPDTTPDPAAVPVADPAVAAAPESAPAKVAAKAAVPATTTPAATQKDVDELKKAVILLTELVNRSRSVPATESTTDVVEASDTAFRYRLLSALMGAASSDGLVVDVKRFRNGLNVVRPLGLLDGTHLSFVADGKPLSFALTNDRVRSGDLQGEAVDDNGALESFVLREGSHGPVVAVAPSLPALSPSPTVV